MPTTDDKRRPYKSQREKKRAEINYDTIFPNMARVKQEDDAAVSQAWNAGDPFRAIGAAFRPVVTAPLAFVQDTLGRPSAAIMREASNFTEGVFGTPAVERTPAKAASTSSAAGPTARRAFGHFTGLQDDPAWAMYQQILKQEGGMRNGQFQRSPAGAWGPAQLMPGTAPEAMELAGYSRGDQRWQTDRDINTKAGFAYYKKQLETFGDPALAAAAYNAGPGRVQQALSKGGPGGWEQFLPEETKNYVNNFRGATGAGGMQIPQGVNPFDPAMFQPQLDAIAEAEKASLEPFQLSTPDVKGPAMPAPMQLPDRDYTETDALMQDLKPVLDLEKDRKRIMRANMFQGLAKGLMASGEGAGIGTILAGVGAGMLAGRGLAEAELQARVDKFDEKMAAWKVANMGYETKKADQLHNDAVAEVTSLYEHNMKQWAVDQADFAKKNFVSFQNGNFIVQRQQDGNLVTQVIPHAPSVRAASAMARASVFGNMAGQAMNGASMEASFQNQLIGGIFSSEYNRSKQAGAQDQEAQMFVSNSLYQATELVRTGVGRQLLGDETYQELSAEVQKTLSAEGPAAGLEDGGARQQELMAAMMAQLLMTNPDFAKRAQTQAPLLFQSYLKNNKEAERRYNRQPTNEDRIK